MNRNHLDGRFADAEMARLYRLRMVALPDMFTSSVMCAGYEVQNGFYLRRSLFSLPPLVVFLLP